MTPALRLPLLEAANGLYPEADLSDVTVLACQHFFVSNFLMFEKLFARGLRPERTFIIPKSYTYNRNVHELFRRRGVMVWQYEYDSHEAFDQRMRQECAAFVGFLRQQQLLDGRVLVLDDGGDLTIVVNEMLDEARCCGVEQTSSGFNKLSTLDLRFPVVNLARADAKLYIESLFIGERIGFKMLSFLEEKGIVPARCLVIGNGPIGAQVLHNLSLYFTTDVFDVETARCGRQGELAAMLGDYDLVFACTGTLSVPAELHARFKPGAVLACASLREFEPHVLRRKVPPTGNPHEHLLVDGVWLVNSGFPANFDGALNDVSPEKIQLTHALNLCGAYQALEATGGGMIPLDGRDEAHIVAEFKELTRSYYFRLYDRGTA